jgi:hypothetical protein
MQNWEKKIEESKAAGEQAIKMLASDGVQLAPLSGSEKQIAWAKQIRATLLTSDIAWVITEIISNNPQITAQAKYWIDRRNRTSDEWIARGTAGTWVKNYPYNSPQARAAVCIMMRYMRNLRNPPQTNAEIVSVLADLAAMPIDDTRPDYNKNFGNDTEQYLVCSWARTGLIEFLHAGMEAAAGKAHPAVEQAAVLDKISEDTRLIDEANRLASTVDAQIERARGKQALAAHLNDQADAALEEAALRLGMRGKLLGKIWIVRELRDDGARVYCSDEESAEWREFVKFDWISAVQILAAEVNHAY